jgi:hypothetical protein
LHARNSFDVARAELSRRSRTPSRTESPRLRAGSLSVEHAGDAFAALAGRDEVSFYQAETQSMVRENQMLRQRIRELGESLDLRLSSVSRADPVERQLADHKNGASHEPLTPSNLLRTQSVSERAANAASGLGGPG